MKKAVLVTLVALTLTSVGASAFEKTLDLSIGRSNGEGGYINGDRVTGNQTDSVRIGGTYGRYHGAIEYGDPTDNAADTAKDKLHITGGVDFYKPSPRTTLSLEGQANKHDDNWTDYGVGLGARYQNDYVRVSASGGVAESEDSATKNGNWREVDIRLTHPKVKGFYVGAKHSRVEFDSTVPLIDEVSYEDNRAYIGYEHKF